MADDLNIPEPVLSRLRGAQRVIALTGAGISAESGIPTFRDLGSGLWSRFDPDQIATPQAWRRNPRLVWGWYASRRMQAHRVAPNAGHLALARLADFYPRFSVVTQNVDGLHVRAGSRDVIELHGNIHRVKCSAEDTVVEWTDPQSEDPAALDALERGEGPDVPVCPTCGALLRPDVVWFGEMLPVDAYRRAEELAATCDACLVVGTSAVVQPAADLPRIARRAGACVVEVNPEETEISAWVDLSLHGPAGVVLPQLVDLIVGP